MRRKLVAANWKMNGTHAVLGQLVSNLKVSLCERNTLGSIDVLVCPPVVYLESVGQLLQGSGLSLGGQNSSEFSAGAYTGEVAPAMLKDAGAEFVLVGHSERRALFGESNECVARKFASALQAGLIPVLCVGESLAQRDADQTWSVIRQQLDAVMLEVSALQLCSAIIAYEPVWAIGTGKTASPEQAQQVHGEIRDYLRQLAPAYADKMRILYGGSVKADSAKELFACPDIDGGLIGGASLDAKQLQAICDAAAD